MERFGAVLPKSGEVDLVLHVKTTPSEDWNLQFEPPLAEQVISQIEDVQAGRNVFRAGRVYCFRCDSSECEHALPPSSLSVFHGYAPNGLPEWAELVQVLIAAKDERVDQLFGAGVLARLQFGHDLRVRQLSSFGRASKTYAILGQVVAGYFPLPNRGEHARESAPRLAITFQAVEYRGDEGAVRLRLNAIARAPGDGELGEMLASGWEPGLYRAREVAGREMEAIEQHVNAVRGQGGASEVREFMKRIPGILRRLAESIERSGRQESRRTRHVEVRRQQHRPVHKALEDALAAAAEALFYDEKAKTTVACGHQGRAHAFSVNGRHVTSFILRPGSVEFRLRTHRWRPLTPEEVEEFKRLLRQSIPPGRE